MKHMKYLSDLDYNEESKVKTIGQNIYKDDLESEQSNEKTFREIIDFKEHDKIFGTLKRVNRILK